MKRIPSKEFFALKDIFYQHNGFNRLRKLFRTEIFCKMLVIVEGISGFLLQIKTKHFCDFVKRTCQNVWNDLRKNHSYNQHGAEIYTFLKIILTNNTVQFWSGLKSSYDVISDVDDFIDHWDTSTATLMEEVCWL